MLAHVSVGAIVRKKQTSQVDCPIQFLFPWNFCRAALLSRRFMLEASSWLGNFDRRSVVSVLFIVPLTITWHVKSSIIFFQHSDKPFFQDTCKCD